MDILFERFPVAVGLDAAKLDNSLSTFFDPAHAAVIAATAEDGFDGAFDDSGGDDEVSTS